MRMVKHLELVDNMEKVKQLTKETLIPISLALILFSGAVWLGSLASRVYAMEQKDSPTRAEYNTMCQQLSDIQKGVNEINTYLRNNK